MRVHIIQLYFSVSLLLVGHLCLYLLTFISALALVKLVTHYGVVELIRYITMHLVQQKHFSCNSEVNALE